MYIFVKFACCKDLKQNDIFMDNKIIWIEFEFELKTEV